MNSNSSVTLTADFLGRCLYQPNLFYADLEAKTSWEEAGLHGRVIQALPDSTIFVANYDLIAVSCSMYFRWFPFDTQVKMSLIIVLHT